MTTSEVTPRTHQEQLISIRQEIQELTTQEVNLRERRNTAVRVAVSLQIPVAHLARDAGLSRELLHRILRNAHVSQPLHDSTAPVAQNTLLVTQESLTTITASRTGAEKRRADVIRQVAATQELTRTQISQFAGVSLETVRKVCLIS